MNVKEIIVKTRENEVYRFENVHVSDNHLYLHIKNKATGDNICFIMHNVISFSWIPEE